MNNNYEYVQRLKQDIEEQEKIKKELKRDLDYLLITEEEKENIITKVFSNEIETYKPTTILPFQKYIKKKLENEINKVYFAPSTIIPIQEQKIIYLYLNQSQNRYLTEDEIRINLHTDSKNVYLALKKLRPASTQIKEELNKLFPNYKRQLKNRQVFFNQTPVISEQDLKYLGYYIGEINDICLSVDEIAKKEGKTESEIQKSLKATFKHLKEEKNIELVKTRYPNCEKMLQIKATNFGIKLFVDKDEKEEETKGKKTAPKQKKRKRTKEKTPQKEKSILTEKQEIMLKELAKNPNISGKELSKLAGYKTPESVRNVLSALKKKCKTNEGLKAKVLELYPDFFNTTPKTGKTLLTKKQETLLKELAKNPNITGKELVKLTEYKNPSNIRIALNKLKKRCETNEELKEKILELYPDFFNTAPKQASPLLTTVQETLLKELAKNPNISGTELVKLTEYKKQNSIMTALNRLKKRCETNEKLKRKVLELCPDFFNIKPKAGKTLLTKKQETLLIELAKNPNIAKKRLSEITGYKDPKAIYQTISILKKKCKTNESLKEKVLELYPDFLNPKPKPEKKKPEKKEKPLLTKKQEILLIELAKNPNISRKELAKLTEYKNQNSVWSTLNMLKKRCKTNEALKVKVLELYPDFLTPKSKTEKKERPLLAKKQETLLRELAKNPNITGTELVKLTEYKSPKAIYKAKSILKKKCKTNEALKIKVLELYPDFLTLKPKTEKKKAEKQERPLLTKNQETLLIELANNPNISRKELAKLTEYKNQNSVLATLNTLKKRCETNEELKIKVLELYPDFLTPKPKPEKKKAEKKERPLLTKNQETLLIELAKNPNIPGTELVKLTEYKNISSIWTTLNKLKKKIKTNEELKAKVLELYPDFLTPKSKTEKKENPLLAKKQEKLLKELAKNPNISRKELAKLTEYKNQNSVWSTLNMLKKRCKTNEALKVKVLELYPDFLTPKPKPEKKKTEKKERPLLTKKQETVLIELAKNPNIPGTELVKLTEYKNISSIGSALNRLKKKCETNEELKEKILGLYPDFLNPNSKKGRKNKQTINQERPLLTKNQETLLKELAKNPNISRKELAKLTEYKNQNSVWTTLNRLKKRCETNAELKTKVLELYPDFLTPKPKPEKKKTEKQERPLLTQKQEILLKELAKNPNISRKELAKLTEYKNKNSIWTTLNTLKKRCETNEELKTKILELYPDFLAPKPKPEKPLLTEKQETLLKELAKNPSIPGNELVKLTEYKNTRSIQATLSILKKGCKTNEALKTKVLELYPDFLNPKATQNQENVLTNQELQILQNIYLINPPKTSYITYEQLSSELQYSKSNIHHIKKKALEKIESTPEIKEEIQEIWPSFEQDKIIREHYKKRRSIKIPSQDLEKIKSFIRQYDIPENNVQEEKRNNILIGIHNLENSIFSSYVSKCTEEQKAMLALRLGFINAPSTTEIVAELFGVEQQEVITLTKNCLQSAKPTLTAKTYQKKKEN